MGSRLAPGFIADGNWRGLVPADALSQSWISIWGACGVRPRGGEALEAQLWAHVPKCA
jgi:hypothetical protein